LAGFAKPSRGPSAISAYLQRAIETGAYSEGDRLPPERQLAATFQAARSTVRARSMSSRRRDWYRAVSAAAPLSAQRPAGDQAISPIR
jgi:DNA-binding transcriptional MocR family regulator